MIGTIKSIFQDKGYGFIRGEGGNEYFFHKDDCFEEWNDLVFDTNSSPESIVVSFEPRTTPKGHRAALVTRT